MLRNFSTATDLNRYIPEKDKYLWKGQTDFSDQITGAEQEVITDLKIKGYKPHKLMTPLTVTTTETEDVVSAGRLVVNCTVHSVDGVVTLLGCNTSDGTYETVTTLSITATGETSVLFTKMYSYYKISNTGTITFSAYLVETSYDLLFIYKTLEIISQNNYKDGAERWGELATWFNEKYQRLISTMPVYEDTDTDGEVTDEYMQKNNSFPMLG